MPRPAGAEHEGELVAPDVPCPACNQEFSERLERATQDQQDAVVARGDAAETVLDLTDLAPAATEAQMVPEVPAAPEALAAPEAPVAPETSAVPEPPFVPAPPVATAPSTASARDEAADLLRMLAH